LLENEKHLRGERFTPDPGWKTLPETTNGTPAHVNRSH
jgi:hypothetical protein